MAFIGSGASLTNLPAPSSANVGTATASIGLGAVGSYAMCRTLLGSAQTAGYTIAGSNLSYANADGGYSGNPSGTWTLFGRTGGNASAWVSVWLRTS
jgi:hypothetical protein